MNFKKNRSVNDYVLAVKCPDCGHEIGKRVREVNTLTVCEKCKVTAKFELVDKKTNKYHNVKVEYNNYIYDSGLEARKAYELDVLKKLGEIKSWERQVVEELCSYGVKICEYWVDFKVYHNDGTSEFIETKGYETAIYRLKKKMLLAKYAKEIKLGIIKFTQEGEINIKKYKLFKK